jgi:hypothetical protein
MQWPGIRRSKFFGLPWFVGALVAAAATALAWRSLRPLTGGFNAHFHPAITSPRLRPLELFV